MNLALTLKSLYALNGVAAVLLYLPQIVRACKDREHAHSLSLISFGGWCVGSLVTALYAWLLVGDRIFTAVSVGNMAGSGSLFLIAAGSRMGKGTKRFWPLSFGAPLPPPLEGEAQGKEGIITRGQRQGTKRTTLRVSVSNSRRDAST